MIDKLYEEVLLEENIKNWILSNKEILKKLIKELSTLGLLFSSAGIMGGYVSNFLQKNFPNLPEYIVNNIVQFINNNPQIINTLLKA